MLMSTLLPVFDSILILSLLAAGVPAAGRQPQKESPVTSARGTFEVKIAPQSDDDPAANIGRMTIDKQFQGDLVATSKGQMLAVTTSVKESAGYVAIERVTGTLQGKRGTFALQHNGIMNRGTPQLTVTVLPDSGTDELTGLTGSMTITIVEGKHLYELSYSLPSGR